MNMKVSDLFKGTEVLEYNGCENLEITGVTGDTRGNTIRKGFAFLCISGTVFDGHTYIAEAAAQGAIVAITERVPECRDIPYVLVKDTRLAASYVFANANGNPERSLKMIGITGTNGKTSSAFMLKKIFEDAGHTCGIIGTILCAWGEKVYDAGMTTPDPERLFGLLRMMKEDGAEYVFMEVSSHSLALGRVAPIRFRAGIYTNLTQDHLDFHKTMEDYAAAKEILFTQSDIGIFNIDNEYVERAAGKKLCPSVTFSAEGKDADYTAGDIVTGMSGVDYSIYKNGEKIIEVSSHIPGIITVYNTMGAVICALECGIPADKIREGVRELSGVPGRMERATPRDCPFTAIIDYAHTPDALENVANIILKSRQKGQKLTILFGCGGDRDSKKRPIMGEIATRLADRTIITSDNCRTEEPEKIINDILAGIHRDSDHTVITDRREAIKHAILTAEDGEIILIAGKGHENYEIKKDGKHPFSEKDEVNKALKLRESAL